MDNWLPDYRGQFQTAIFDYLWRQWSLLGVAGVTRSSDERIIDPEALLLFSLSVCRYEPRLFDEILDWLIQNGHFINVQRLKQMQRKYPFACGPQLSAGAHLLSQNGKYKLKWSGLIGKYVADPAEPLFLDNQGHPLPYPLDGKACPEFKKHGLMRGKIQPRGHSQSFDAQNPACLVLRLRALMGMHARAEILCLLASVTEIHPAEAARQTTYYQKTVQTALLEMTQSGAILTRTSQKAKFYRLKPATMDALLKPNNTCPQWLHWPSVLWTIDTIQQGLHKLARKPLESLLLASELRKLLKVACRNCLDSGLHEIDLGQRVPTEDIIPYFQSRVLALGRYLNSSVADKQ